MVIQSRVWFAAVICVLLLSSAEQATAWFENGHHLIAVMAYEQLTAEQQKELQRQLQQHPRYADDFKPPADLTAEVEVNHWLIGRASYWPDVARGSSFDRPTWHYELGATKKIGEPKDVPNRPGPLPKGSTLDSQGLYLSQAIELCRSIWRDKSAGANDRALALCWLGHLVADSHQPCHSGSLYSPHLLSRGDRGGNSITLKQAANQQTNNLHLFWDARLGSMFNVEDLNRRWHETTADTELIAEANRSVSVDRGLEPLTWIHESSELGLTYVYTPEVLARVKIADQAKSQTIEPVELSDEYVAVANRVARKRAAQAAWRLAKIWAEGL